MAIGDSGYVFIAGSFQETVQFGNDVSLTSNGWIDTFIAKYDTSGNCIWAINMGGEYDDYCYSIVLDENGNIYGTGSFGRLADFDPSDEVANLSYHGPLPLFSDAFIAKYDSTGVIISVISEPIGTSGNPHEYFLKSSIVDNYGNIFVGGSIHSASGEYYAFIRKYSSTNLTLLDEEISSSNTSGGGWNNTVFDIVSDGSGGVYLAGLYQDDMTIGGIYLAPDNTNHQQGFVFHWNSSGNVPWANSIGDINESNLDDFASSIIVDQNNDILVDREI